MNQPKMPFARWFVAAGILGAVMGIITFARAHPIEGIILITGAIMILLVPSVMSSIARIRPVTWYKKRADSDAAMLRDMSEYSTLVFLGVSHRSLPMFLRQVLQVAGPRYRSAPWRSIDVYFADDAMGRIWEGDAFSKTVLDSRFDICEQLMSGPDRTRHLTQLRFWQSRDRLMYGGCLFGNDLGSSVGVNEFGVLYVVNYLPSPDLNLEKCLTFSLRRAQKRALDVFLAYESAFDTIKSNADSLGSFTHTIWDRSAPAWNRFVQECPAYCKSMKTLAEFAGIGGDDRILDVGSGPGVTSAVLLEDLSPSGKLVLLDQSAPMLRLARGELASHQNVDYALCAIPTGPRGDVDIEHEKFTVIVGHLILPTIGQNQGELESFSRWCKVRLDSGGRVVIAVHNTALEMNAPSRWKNWPDRDPLRKGIKDMAQKKGKLAFRPPQGTRIKSTEIETAFRKSGFEVHTTHERTFEEPDFTMEHRILLWKVPAVLDSMIDISDPGNWLQAVDVVDDVAKDIINHPTMPMIVKYFSFKVRTG